MKVSGKLPSQLVTCDPSGKKENGEEQSHNPILPSDREDTVRKGEELPVANLESKCHFLHVQRHLDPFKD
jgi:hypothetical protein